MCRLCLVQDSTFYDIFSYGMEEAVRLIIGISINPRDNWPKSICRACINEIENIQRLITSAKMNESILTATWGEYAITVEDPVKVEVVEARVEDLIEECIDEEDEKIEWLEKWQEECIEEVCDEGNDECEIAVAHLIADANEEDIRMVDTFQDENDVIEEKSKARNQWTKHPIDIETQEKIDEFFKMECPKCFEDFPTFASIMVHFKDVHKCPGYIICCRRRLLSYRMLYEHMQKHLNPELECLASEKSLNSHQINKHTPVEMCKYTCANCAKRFSCLPTLKSHMYTHMCEEDKYYICNTCHKAFATKYQLATHTRSVHSDEDYEICTICTKSFKTKNRFQKHMMQHEGTWQRNFQCTTCGKLFYENRALQKHQERHDTQIHVCTICQHQSVNRQTLLHHIERNHTKVKVYKCPVCEKLFKRKESLKNHWAAHLGMKQYQCQWCNKEFSSYQLCYLHKKTEHPDEFHVGESKIEA